MYDENDMVPEYLIHKYMPLMNDLFIKFNQLAQRIEENPELIEDPDVIEQKDAMIASMDGLWVEFVQDGGNDEMWNKMAPAIHHTAVKPENFFENIKP